ncbi:CRISPR-associated helicase Cas3', partial [Streptomyces durbertensis]
AMFARLRAWLDRLPTEDGTRLSVHLAHSKSALNDEFAELLRSSHQRIAAVDAESPAPSRSSRRPHGARAAHAELVAHTWLRGRKKAMLASFVAGTVDQLLFAGLKSRHLALRHLAVAGKVVVIDEAHAYDTYMNVYLDRVLAWLGAYRVPVVILSATLPADRRRQLVDAYATGREGQQPQATDTLDETPGDYPLLTAVVPGEPAPLVERPAQSARGGRVHLEALEDDDPEALADRLTDELRDGGCALVVRNTVRRVLETARVLRARFGDEHVTVAHSNFLDLDRMAKDADLLRRFGPPGRATGRPTGPHVVVASQVAEQSLDVDFDLLVTDLCPVDLMLQRMGRLHRHPRGVDQVDRPPRLRTARCLVTGVDWSADVPEPARGSVAVYGAYPLLRSAAALLPHLVDKEPLTLPDDINPLVQLAYGPDESVPPAWADALADARARHERKRAEQAARADVFRLGPVARPGRPLIGWIAAGVGDADDTPAGRAQVRDSRESLEVLVVRRSADGTLTTVPWLPEDRDGRPRAGLPLPTDRLPTPAAARAAVASALRLPAQFSTPEVTDRAIAELEQLDCQAWQSNESQWLAGELPLVLDEDCQTRLAGFSLTYSPYDGLEVTRD